MTPAAARAHLTAAAVLGLAALAIPVATKIGPVILVLTATHGVHAGDALALAPGAAGVWLLARALRSRQAAGTHAAPPASATGPR